LIKPTRVRHVFVEFVPEELAPATLYISIEYATTVHACLCGCGSRIVTPLSPTDWRMTFDGETVSLSPSIGKWSFACQSHYWIVSDTVRWAGRMSVQKIQVGRERDGREKQAYYFENRSPADGADMPASLRAVRWLRRVFRRG
jgi:hypothetical protein